MTYVTKTQHDNTVKMMLGAVLATEEGSAMANTTIARTIGTSTWAVGRCRKTLRDCGLLGRGVIGDSLEVPRAPRPTYENFWHRVAGLEEWIEDEDEYGLVDIPDAIRYEVTSLIELLDTEGSLKDIGSELFEKRLERIEEWVEEAADQVPEEEYVAVIEARAAVSRGSNVAPIL